MHVVVNHLRLREPVPESTVEAARQGMQLVVDSGALAARLAKVDEKNLILILEFSTAEDADRTARSAARGCGSTSGRCSPGTPNAASPR